MMRFAPNLRWLFTELPLQQRFAAAARAGFTEVEFSFHYEVGKADLKLLLNDSGLRLVAALTPVHWDKGERGIAALPGRAEEFRRSAEIALDYAAALGIASLHAAPGEIAEDMDRRRCHAQYLENLAWLADRARPLGTTIVLEPVCTARFARFLIHRLDEGAAIVQALGRYNVKLVFDTYHVQMEHGALTQNLERYWPMVGHVQIGNAPNRQEPGKGELDLAYFIDLAAAKGCALIGLEYTPSSSTAASLEWARPFGIRPERI